MKRTHKLLAWIIGVPVALLAVLVSALVITLSLFNWNKLKPTINAQASTAIGRPFAINGNLGVQWMRDASSPGWRAWMPWPHIVAQDGLFRTRLFVFDTQDALIDAKGMVNFANEKMDLDVTPHTKGLRVLSLRSPLYVRGTSSSPTWAYTPARCWHAAPARWRWACSPRRRPRCWRWSPPATPPTTPRPAPRSCGR